MEDKNWIWTNQRVKDFAEIFSSGSRISIEQFISLHSPKKEDEGRERDWEVVKYFNAIERHHSPTPICKSHGCLINSVRRLSDNTVWTVGGYCGTKHFSKDRTKSFEIMGNDIVVHFDDAPSCSLHWLSKLPPERTKLFTTEDGVDIYPNDKCWEVMDNFRVYPVSYYPDDTPNQKAKYFSTEEKAKEYVLMNKPFLSIQVVMDRLYAYFKNPKDAYNNIMALAQSKLS